MIKATFLAGLGVGVKLLAELLDGDFLFEKAGKFGEKNVNKNFKNASADKKLLLKIVSTLGIIGIGVGGFALLYTLFKAPKIAYDGKVNAFTKGKDMDVYIRSNSAEKEIFTQLNDIAKTSSVEEKEDLKASYLQLEMAKTRVPGFINLKI